MWEVLTWEAPWSKDNPWQVSKPTSSAVPVRSTRSTAQAPPRPHTSVPPWRPAFPLTRGHPTHPPVLCVLRQVVTTVTEGGRLRIPAPQDLPGPSASEFEGLDTYLALIQHCWAQNACDRPSFNEVIVQLRSVFAGSVRACVCARTRVCMRVRV